MGPLTVALYEDLSTLILLASAQNILYLDNNANRIDHCVSAVLYCWQLHAYQQYNGNALLPYHGYFCCANATECSVLRTFPVLFIYTVGGGGGVECVGLTRLFYLVRSWPPAWKKFEWKFEPPHLRIEEVAAPWGHCSYKKLRGCSRSELQQLL
jgi:hypothetical protein